MIRLILLLFAALPCIVLAQQNGFKIAADMYTNRGPDFVMDSNATVSDVRMNDNVGTSTTQSWSWLGGVANSSLVHASSGLCLGMYVSKSKKF